MRKKEKKDIQLITYYISYLADTYWTLYLLPTPIVGIIMTFFSGYRDEPVRACL